MLVQRLCPRHLLSVALLSAGLGFAFCSTALADFINFETPQVHPVDISPDGTLLAVCNTADNRIEIFDITTGSPVAIDSIPVGLDPVSARFRTDSELWAVNQISDSVSVIDIDRKVVVRTIATRDEPADVVFAGAPSRSYISCSQVDTVMVFDPADPTTVVAEIAIEGEDPRALAVSPDGMLVYAAVFESGNRSTILGGGGDEVIISSPPNVVSHIAGPYSGQNPPPNSGILFEPAKNPAAGAAPEVGLIVKQDSSGRWMDDNAGDWTALVSGQNAALSGRPVGWELIDHDVAIIDTTSNSVSYAEGLMNICMAMGVNPVSGAVSVVGTDATNEIRFEPVVNGTFVSVQMGSFHPSSPAATSISDLNDHLDYLSPTIAQGERDKSLGDPRGIVWNAAGTRAFVSGMGSNNVIVVDQLGNRSGMQSTIEVGEGPTGLVLDENRGRLYVLNRFAGSISTVDLNTELEIARTPLFDPTPEAIKTGRKHLYDTHRTSGLGHVSCASCHVDSRVDRLAWDLGDPSGGIKAVSSPKHNLGGNFPGLNTNFTDFHPMKGPMTTQTLQDIIGKEPHHWRGDRDGIEEFNDAFVKLLGDDVHLTTVEMQEFEDYLATIFFPPNPFRNTDNSLADSLALPGHFKSGRFGGAGDPMPAGDPDRALNNTYRPLARGIDRGVFSCVTCHTLPTGMGTDTEVAGLLSFEELAPGPKGERHHALVSVDGSSQRAIKIPHLRNLYDKVGFEMTQMKSRAGFGFAHDGSVDSITRFMSEGAFEPDDDQEVADLVALMLSFTGSGFGSRLDIFEPPGTSSQDVHAAVGKQATLTSGSPGALLTQLLGLADTGAIGVVAKSVVNGQPRGWVYTGSGNFDSDELLVSENLGSLLGKASTATPVTFTAVPAGCETRIGIDRDRDGLPDYDEVRDFALATPGIQNPFDPANPDASGDNGNSAPDGISDDQNDFDGDGITNFDELLAGSNPADNLVASPPLELRIGGDPNLNTVTLTWVTQPGAMYEIEYTIDLVLWIASGTGSIAAPLGGGEATWTDIGPPATDALPSTVPKRFYRVIRTQ